MGHPTIQVSDRRATVEVVRGATVETADRSTQIVVVRNGCVLELPVARTAVEVVAGAVVAAALVSTVVEFQSVGVQGPPGPGSDQEVFDGAPDPLPGNPALVFEDVTIGAETVSRMSFVDPD